MALSRVCHSQAVGQNRRPHHVSTVPVADGVPVRVIQAAVVLQTRVDQIRVVKGVRMRGAVSNVRKDVGIRVRQMVVRRAVMIHVPQETLTHVQRAQVKRVQPVPVMVNARAAMLTTVVQHEATNRAQRGVMSRVPHAGILVPLGRVKRVRRVQLMAEASSVQRVMVSPHTVAHDRMRVLNGQLRVVLHGLKGLGLNHALPATVQRLRVAQPVHARVVHRAIDHVVDLTDPNHCG